MIAVLPQIRKTNERIDSLFYFMMSAGLKRELYHLRDTGFIEVTDSKHHAIQQIPTI